MRLRAAFATLVLACGLTAWPIAQAAAQVPGTPPVLLPADAAQLDLLLSQKNYLALGDVLRQAKRAELVVPDLNWERQRMMAGATLFINFVYAEDLWRLAAVLPADKATALQDTAVMVLLYGYELIDLDGVKCADASAPCHRLDQLIAVNRPAWRHIAAMTDHNRALTIDVVLRLESATAPKRGNDNFLCRGGVEETMDALGKGDKPLQVVPNPAGTAGRTLVVPPDPDYEPKFVDKKIWLPKQQAARKAMPGELRQIVDKFSTATVSYT